jgi:hypothetical protein
MRENWEQRSFNNSRLFSGSCTQSFSYPEPFLRAVRRGALAKSISEVASDWLVLTPDIVFLPCFYGIRLWIWPEPFVALCRTRVRRALGTRMAHNKLGCSRPLHTKN